MRQLADILEGLTSIQRGREVYFKLAEVREALQHDDSTELAVDDGVCVAPFCLTSKGTYELHWYEFNLNVVPDPEKSEERLRISEIRNTADWHKRLRNLTPKFVKEGTSDFPKKWLLDWFDYVLTEPEVMRELRSVFEGKKITKKHLFVAFY